jgi:subtilase family serine protease
MAISIEYPFSGTFRVSQTATGTFSHTDKVDNNVVDYWVAAYDFATPANTPVLAVATGIVVDYRQAGYTSSGLGSNITIQYNVGTANEFYATYAHLAANSILPARGASVSTGETLALAGNTGESYGNHIHIQFSLEKYLHPSGDVYAKATDAYDNLIDFNGVRPAENQYVTGQSASPISDPDLIASNVAVSDTTPNPGQSVTVTYDISNIGSGSAVNTTAGIYLSTNNFISTSDTLLATQLSSISNSPGSVDPETQAVTLPGNLAPGNYWIGVVADYNNQETGESNESNNNSSGIMITIPQPQQDPDLIASNVAVSDITPNPGQSVTVTYNISNIGSGSAVNTTAGIYLSTNNFISTSDTLLATQLSSISNNPGSVDPETQAVSLPGNLAPGNYWVGVVADYNNQETGESNESNNNSSGIMITIPQPQQDPDLSEYVIVSDTTVAAGGSTTIDAYAMNLGDGTSAASTAGFYLSTNAIITTGDTLLTTKASPGLAAVGQSGYYDYQNFSVTLPGNLATGTYYIGGIADYNGQVSESDENNNTYNVVQIEVTAPAQPDLSEYVSVSNTTLAAGGSTTIDAYAMNLGDGASAASTAGFYLSSDATITTGDTLLATITSPGLATIGQPGYYDYQSFSVALPGNLATGTYYIGGIADYNGAISESDETNNTYNTVEITVTSPAQPDLSEYIALSDTSIAAGGSTTIDAYAMNLGDGASAASTAGFYLSSDATITTGDTLLATITSPGLATIGQPGYYDYQNFSVALPGNLATGTYYIGGIADYNGAISESDEANNTYNTVEITVTGPAQPDLSEYIALSDTSIAAGGSTTIDAYAMNLGDGASAASTAGFYLSSDATITTGDTLLATITSPGLATIGQPGYYDYQNFSVALPGNLATGTYYIGGIADYNGQVSESDENNNTYNVAQIEVFDLV